MTKEHMTLATAQLYASQYGVTIKTDPPLVVSKKHQHGVQPSNAQRETLLADLVATVGAFYAKKGAAAPDDASIRTVATITTFSR